MKSDRSIQEPDFVAEYSALRCFCKIQNISINLLDGIRVSNVEQMSNGRVVNFSECPEELQFDKPIYDKLPAFIVNDDADKILGLLLFFEQGKLVSSE